MNKRARPASSSHRPIAALLLLALMAAVATVAAGANPTGLVAALGMLPTVTVFVLDRSDGRAAACAIGGMNIAGVIPFLPELLAQGRWPGSYAGLEDVVAFIAMYGAAAAGWALVTLLPPITDAIERAMIDRRCRRLRRRQRELVEIWGNGVRRQTRSTAAPSM